MYKILHALIIIGILSLIILFSFLACDDDAPSTSSGQANDDDDSIDDDDDDDDNDDDDNDTGDDDDDVVEHPPILSNVYIDFILSDKFSTSGDIRLFFDICDLGDDLYGGIMQYGPFGDPVEISWLVEVTGQKVSPANDCQNPLSLWWNWSTYDWDGSDVEICVDFLLVTDSAGCKSNSVYDICMNLP